MSFYRLRDNVCFEGRWHLGDIRGVDNWGFVSMGCASDEKTIEVCRPGVEMDFTLSEVYGVPVVSDKVKAILARCGGVSFVPLTVEPAVSKDDFYAMIISNVIDCVNEEVSEFRKFEVDDPVRPDKAGEYRGFMKLQVDPEKLVGVEICRVEKFEIAIIVADSIKHALDLSGATGLSFELVSDSSL